MGCWALWERGMRCPVAEGAPQGFMALQGGQGVMVQVHVVGWAPQHRQPLATLHLHRRERAGTKSPLGPAQPSSILLSSTFRCQPILALPHPSQSHQYKTKQRHDTQTNLQGADAAVVGDREHGEVGHRIGDGRCFTAWLHLLRDALHQGQHHALDADRAALGTPQDGQRVQPQFQGT